MARSSVSGYRSLLSLATLAFAVLASAEVRAWDASGACTELEKWELPKQLEPAWVEAFAVLLHPEKRGDTSLITFQRLGAGKSNPWAKYFGRYGSARSLYKMGLYRYAFAEFEKVLDSSASAALPLMRSAIECMVTIRRKGHSSLLPGPAALEVLYRFPVAKSDEAAELVVASALQKIRLQPTADVSREIAVLHPKPAFAKFLQGVQAARAHREKEAIALLEPLVKDPSKPAYISRSQSMLQLLLARAYYAEKRYVEADRMYRAVSPMSPEIAPALSESAWAALQAGNYPAAINASLNFDTGPLQGSYSPESYLVAAIGLFEICRFPEARQRVAEFLRIYGPEFAWLEKWSKQPSGVSMYETLISSLKKPSLPSKIQRELSTAPSFVAYQTELNSLVDEQARIGVYQRSYAKTKRPEYVALKAGLQAYQASLPKYRQALIGWLDYEFRERLKRMHAQLKDIKENTDSVLVEIFNAAGEEMIADHSAGSPERKERGLTSSAPFGRGPKMNWGAAPKPGQPAAEVWSDEVGGIEQDLSDRCLPAEPTGGES